MEFQDEEARFCNCHVLRLTNKTVSIPPLLHVAINLNSRRLKPVTHCAQIRYRKCRNLKQLDAEFPLSVRLD
jgi:hypothetical protein